MRDWIIISIGIVTPRPTMREIAKAYAAAHGVTLEALQGPGRHKAIFTIRAGAMRAIRAQTKHSLPRIGQFFGGRDHTTVMHAIRRVEGASVQEARKSRALAQQEVAA